MSDDKERTEPVDETGEPWVTGAPTVAQRVPGIDEAQETTYVDPEHPGRSSWWRAALIGTGIGLVATAIFAAVMVSSDSDAGSDETVIGAGATASSSTTRSTTATTSVEWWRRATSTTVSPPATTSTTAPPPSALAAAVTPATPRATASPALAPYTKVPLPNGVSATMTTCAWQPTNGGQYEAGGTVTNGPSTNHGWTLTIHWLQNDREIATQSAVVPLTAGQSAPWNLTLSAPAAPADPFSCALTAA